MKPGSPLGPLVTSFAHDPIWNKPTRVCPAARAETIGRPLGDDAFIARLERLSGRTLRPGKPGPKPAGGVSPADPIWCSVSLISTWLEGRCCPLAQFGSHKLGLLESVYDISTGYKLWVIPKERMIEVLRNAPPPVAVTGRAGTAALFHCNVLHASGHNLSAEDRWHIYISCNAVTNRPALGTNPRPDWVVSRNWYPLPIEDDEGVTRAA